VTRPTGRPPHPSVHTERPVSPTRVILMGDYPPEVLVLAGIAPGSRSWVRRQRSGFRFLPCSPANSDRLRPRLARRWAMSASPASTAPEPRASIAEVPIRALSHSTPSTWLRIGRSGLLALQ
jgi:hypothetical protein